MTAIAAFFRPKEQRIVLAADSLFVGHRDRQPVTLHAPKIRAAGRWHYLVAGYCSHAESARDAFELIEEAIAPTTTIADAVSALRALTAQFGAGLKALSDDGAARPMFECFIAGSYPLALAFFTVKVDSVTPFRVHAEHGITPALGSGGDLSYSASLAGGPCLDLMTPPRPAWLERGDAEAARRLIELQCAATPERVGGTVSVLEVTPGRTRWIEAPSQRLSGAMTATIDANAGTIGALTVDGGLTVGSGGSITAGGVTIDEDGITLTSGTSAANILKFTGGAFIQESSAGILHCEGSSAVSLNTSAYAVGLINGNAAFEPISGTPTLGSNSVPWSNLYLSGIGAVVAVLNDFESRISALENP